MNDPKHYCSGCTVDDQKKLYLDTQVQNPKSSLIFDSTSKKYHSNKCKRIILEGKKCDKCSNLDRLYRKRIYSSDSNSDDTDIGVDDGEKHDESSHETSESTPSHSTSSTSKDDDIPQGLDSHSLLSVVLAIDEEKQPLNKEFQAVLSGDKSGKLHIWWKQQMSALIAKSTGKDHMIR